MICDGDIFVCINYIKRICMIKQNANKLLNLKKNVIHDPASPQPRVKFNTIRNSQSICWRIKIIDKKHQPS